MRIEDFNDCLEEDDDDSSAFAGEYTVSMKGAPNMATVQWCSSEREALDKTAREWGCKSSDCYIYKGQDE